MGGHYKFVFDSAHRDWHGIVGLVAEKVKRYLSREEQFKECRGISNENE
jgi:hypothetical protein